eukprot:CAMPEP_0170623542 /NCGR_PEP_ID=MMETSP0224-20130122/29755_1 /TAXON_ID=285029 /ORGANISM="Togula jolla, Strain CCCM 725" /LENGTH=126 /DNA_ID=CAMNT_0010950005 /DNA_START=34 /DNA_END=414 /DNA_ORIENTATION=-
MARFHVGMLLAISLGTVMAWQLASLCFVAAPQTQLRGPVHGAVGAAVASIAAVQPAAALTDSLDYDGWGPLEITAVVVPIAFACGLYLEWESKQPSVDGITGVGTLGKTIDGPPGDEYYRRSPESG